MFSILTETELNNVNSHIYDMIKELPLKKRIEQYHFELDLFKDEESINEGMYYAF